MISSFYFPSKWGDRWGSTVNRTSPHKGLDIPAAARAGVPAVRGGTVVASGPSSSVGWYMTIRADDGGEYDTYCHVVPGRVVGQRVEANEHFALVAGASDAHGVDWSGSHLHLCRSTTAGGWSSWGGSNYNPEDIITSLLGGTAGLPQEGEEDMDPAILQELRENGSECRRMLAVLLGARPPAGNEKLPTDPKVLAAALAPLVNTMLGSMTLDLTGTARPVE